MTNRFAPAASRYGRRGFGFGFGPHHPGVPQRGPRDHVHRAFDVLTRRTTASTPSTGRRRSSGPSSSSDCAIWANVIMDA